jgi:hypothetical protein
MTNAFVSETLLNTAAAAKRLGVSSSFLAKARMQGVGPPYCKFGRVVRYTPANLDRYELERRRTSTAEEPPVTEAVRKASAEPKRSSAVDDRVPRLHPRIRANVDRRGRRNKSVEAPR